MNPSITDVLGIKVGHAQNDDALTGCTVIICEKGATGGIDQRGGAPGTRETDLMRPMHLVDKVHAILLAGGSAFGLDAATGVMKYLEERKIGFNTGVAYVPIVAGAVIFDLAIGNSNIRPDATMGYKACQNASSLPPQQGNAGAGSGATVGKILGMEYATKSGIGTFSIRIGNLVVGAIMVVNALGDVVEPDTGKIIAGVWQRDDKQKRYFADTLRIMQSMQGQDALKFASTENTVIGVVATNARLNKEQANKVAQMAQDGIALAVRPAHTMLDGDTIFALATNRVKADVNIVGAFAAQAVANAIVTAVRSSQPVAGLPAANSL